VVEEVRPDGVAVDDPRTGRTHESPEAHNREVVAGDNGHRNREKSDDEEPAEQTRDVFNRL